MNTDAYLQGYTHKSEPVKKKKPVTREEDLTKLVKKLGRKSRK